MGYDKLTARNQLYAAHTKANRNIAKTPDAFMQIASAIPEVSAFSLNIWDQLLGI